MPPRNFHPDFGYLLPTPSFLRIVRVASIATAAGVVAGASVTLILVANLPSEPSDSSVAMRTMVRDASSAPAPPNPFPTKGAPAPAAGVDSNRAVVKADKGAPPSNLAAPALEQGHPAHKKNTTTADVRVLLPPPETGPSGKDPAIAPVPLNRPERGSSPEVGAPRAQRQVTHAHKERESRRVVARARPSDPERGGYVSDSSPFFQDW